jgi:multidrug efflux system outer membrane protein
MVNNKQTLIRFRQSLIFAVNEVASAKLNLERSKDHSECVAFPSTITDQAAKKTQEIFKNKLGNFLQVITDPGRALHGESDLANIKNAQRDAAVDLCRSVGDLWRSLIITANSK